MAGEIEPYSMATEMLAALEARSVKSVELVPVDPDRNVAI